MNDWGDDHPTRADYEEVLADHRRLVRELDVLLNGEAGAAKQASLCDIVGQIKGIIQSREFPCPSDCAFKGIPHGHVIGIISQQTSR